MGSSRMNIFRRTVAFFKSCLVSINLIRDVCVSGFLLVYPWQLQWQLQLQVDIGGNSHRIQLSGLIWIAPIQVLVHKSKEKNFPNHHIESEKSTESLTRLMSLIRWTWKNEIIYFREAS